MNIFKQKEREFALQRTDMLRERFPEAGELLSFLKGVLEFQRQVIEDLQEKDPPFDVGSAPVKAGEGKPAINLRKIDWGALLSLPEKASQGSVGHGDRGDKVRGGRDLPLER
ncbi:MAG: hypothetical protein Q9N34_02940 [Aquificota bacterium]|nr:hypothetical protein [Aquificota bacterium]